MKITEDPHIKMFYRKQDTYLKEVGTLLYFATCRVFIDEKTLVHAYWNYKTTEPMQDQTLEEPWVPKQVYRNISGLLWYSVSMKSFTILQISKYQTRKRLKLHLHSARHMNLIYKKSIYFIFCNYHKCDIMISQNLESC